MSIRAVRWIIAASFLGAIAIAEHAAQSAQPAQPVQPVQLAQAAPAASSPPATPAAATAPAAPAPATPDAPAAAAPVPSTADAAAAKPDIAKGQTIAAQVCAACHNADGNSIISANPKLAGLPAEYLYKQLVDLSRDPDDKLRREAAAMSVFAKMLSDPDKRNVAAYFASQVPKPGEAHDKDSLDDGQRIYRAGVPERAIPACAGCHGPAGDGLPVVYPRIGGQHAEYIVAELKAWRDGTRRNSVPMVAIAARLRESEANAVADYIDGLHR